MVRRVRLLRGLTLAGGALVTACTKSPEDKAEEAAKTLASWQATVHLLEEQRSRGALPGQFVQQVLRAAAEAREEAAAQHRAAGDP
jgi:hypothetical protein